MNFRTGLLGMAAGLCAVASLAKAQPTVYEPFAASPGDPLLGSSTHGTGISRWSTSAPNPGSFVGGLTYGTLETSGSAIAFTGVGSAAYTGTLATNLAPFATASFYLSALGEIPAGGGAGTYDGIQFAGVFTGYGVSGGLGAGIGPTMLGGATLAEAMSPGQVYLFVDQFQVTNVGGGNFSVEVTSSVGLDGGTSGALALVGSFTVTDNNANDFGQLILESDGNADWDEIRIGSSQADVTPGLAAVPEPGSWPTGAGVAALLLTLATHRLGRRRHSSAVGE